MQGCSDAGWGLKVVPSALAGADCAAGIELANDDFEGGSAAGGFG